MPSKPLRYFASNRRFDKRVCQNIQSGDVVWLESRFVPEFFRSVLPTVTNPFVLVICPGDESFSSEYGFNAMEIQALIFNDKIIHIFAQNCDDSGSSGKVSPIPIGLNFHTAAYLNINGYLGIRGTSLEQEACLTEILSDLKPTCFRKQRALLNF